MNETRTGDNAALPDHDRFHSVHVPGRPSYTELDWEPLRTDGAARVRSYGVRTWPMSITGGVGHNLPQEAPEAFAQAVMDVAAS